MERKIKFTPESIKENLAKALPKVKELQKKLKESKLRAESAAKNTILD